MPRNAWLSAARTGAAASSSVYLLACSLRHLDHLAPEPVGAASHHLLGEPAALERTENAEHTALRQSKTVADLPQREGGLLWAECLEHRQAGVEAVEAVRAQSLLARHSIDWNMVRSTEYGASIRPCQGGWRQARRFERVLPLTPSTGSARGILACQPTRGGYTAARCAPRRRRPLDPPSRPSLYSPHIRGQRRPRSPTARPGGCAHVHGPPDHPQRSAHHDSRGPRAGRPGRLGARRRPQGDAASRRQGGHDDPRPRERDRLPELDRGRADVQRPLQLRQGRPDVPGPGGSPARASARTA